MFFEFGIKDFIDILLVAFVLYYTYKLMKASGSIKVFTGILVFILALIGLTALIYPDSRSLLIRQGLQVWQEFLRLL